MIGVNLSLPVTVGTSPAINLGLGSKWSWFDLDNAATLAWVLNATGKSAATELIGTGTDFPIGFELNILMRIAYKAKSFDTTGTITGGVDTTTELYKLFNPDPAFIPTYQADLLCDSYEHSSRANTDPHAYVTTIQPGTGMKYLDVYYPRAVVQVSVDPTSQITSGAGASGRTVVGSWNWYGKSTDLYENFTPSPPVNGDISTTEASTWP